MKKRNRYSIPAFLWNLIQALMFWEKPRIGVLEINTLYPIEGAPVILFWETKRSLWVSIKGAKGVFPPKGSLAVVLKAGERQIQVTAYGLATRATSKLAFHVKAYKGKNATQLTMSTPNLHVKKRERITEIFRIGEICTPRFELKFSPTKIRNPEIKLNLDTQAIKAQLEVTREKSRFEEIKHQYK
jgi:hypothetical protein